MSDKDFKQMVDSLFPDHDLDDGMMIEFISYLKRRGIDSTEEIELAQSDVSFRTEIRNILDEFNRENNERTLDMKFKNMIESKFPDHGLDNEMMIEFIRDLRSRGFYTSEEIDMVSTDEQELEKLRDILDEFKRQNLSPPPIESNIISINGIKDKKNVNYYKKGGSKTKRKSLKRKSLKRKSLKRKSLKQRKKKTKHRKKSKRKRR